MENNKECTTVIISPEEKQLLGAILQECTLSQQLSISTILEKGEKRAKAKLETTENNANEVPGDTSEKTQ
ncbi:hypothetical protein [Runella rosea]|uniref:hypothetical protein n=1 Tax=Runella rosea TaxID=2259595 RepID=UPI0013B3FBEF|nr:hypothetical protein [Runella rosea]